MNHKHRLLLPILFLLTFNSHALSTDKDKPMVIKANSAEIDSEKNLVTYLGNVDARQGTLHIKGSVLTIKKTDDKIETIIVVGKPATYKQRPDNKQKDTVAKAGEIRIFPQKDLVTLEHNANITQEDNLYKADMIEYDNKNDIIEMSGITRSRTPDKKNKGRIHMVIQPDKK